MNPAAIACVVALLGYHGPLPEPEIWPFSPEGTTICRITGQARCSAATMKFPESQGGRIVVVIAPDATFGLQLRESWNVVRILQGLPIHGDIAERAGDQFQERALRECNP